jgi:hypothetical protein
MAYIITFMALRCCQRETPSPDAPVPLGAEDI